MDRLLDLAHQYWYLIVIPAGAGGLFLLYQFTIRPKLDFARAWRAKTASLSQRELLREELRLIGSALLVIVVLFGFLVGLGWYLTR